MPGFDAAVRKNEAYAFMMYGSEKISPGILTAIYGIRLADVSRRIVVLATDPTEEMARTLAIFDAEVRKIPLVEGPQFCVKQLGLAKARLLNSFTKLHIWNLTDFSTVLYMESDTMLRCSVDDLFHYFRELVGGEKLMIAPVGSNRCVKNHPNAYYNTGVMFLHPSARMVNRYAELMEIDSFECRGGSQTLENLLFVETFQPGTETNGFNK